MKGIFQTTLLGALSLAMMLAVGCTSEKQKDAAMARVGDEGPPDFVTGPALVSLEKFEGFSADVVATAANGAPAVSGQLIGLMGRLIYQPSTTANIKNAKYYRGGMFFIWDTSTQKGYVLSEALQGYAPITNAASVTNQVDLTAAPVSEIVNGHPCHRGQLLLALSDGSGARLTEWRADDLRHFPVRVRAETAGREVTVDLTNIRLDLPSRDLFLPPASFTRYASSMALINELMIRESALRSGPTGPMAAPTQPDEHPAGIPAGEHP
jgi:hypothetical protein